MELNIHQFSLHEWVWYLRQHTFLCNFGLREMVAYEEKQHFSSLYTYQKFSRKVTHHWMGILSTRGVIIWWKVYKILTG